MVFELFKRRGDHDLIEALHRQITATSDAAVLALTTAQGGLATQDARNAMRDLEHVGDRRQQAVTHILRHSFAAPIDREDLFRASRSIDDILDNLRDFVREYDLFDLTSDELLRSVLEAIIDGITALHAAVDVLGRRVSPDHDATVAARKNGIRQRYQVAVATLLSQDFDERTLKRRELLRRLDVVGIRISEATDALADGAMKRSH